MLFFPKTTGINLIYICYGISVNLQKPPITEKFEVGLIYFDSVSKNNSTNFMHENGREDLPGPFTGICTIRGMTSRLNFNPVTSIPLAMTIQCEWYENLQRLII
jgi:hypothetical protein